MTNHKLFTSSWALDRLRIPALHDVLTVLLIIRTAYTSQPNVSELQLYCLGSCDSLVHLARQHAPEHIRLKASIIALHVFCKTNRRDSSTCT